MNRRQFLSFAAVPVAAAVAIPELTKLIMLPPRGGWPHPSRYLTSNTTWYLKTDHALGLKTFRRGNKLMTAAEFRASLADGLNKFWRDAYDGKLLDQDGNPLPPFPDTWPDIYGTAA